MYEADVLSAAAFITQLIVMASKSFVVCFVWDDRLYENLLTHLPLVLAFPFQIVIDFPFQFVSDVSLRLEVALYKASFTCER